MKCYRQSECCLYEMLPCNECPASKSEYLKKTDMPHWIWDPNGIDWGIGAWRCSKCQAVNQNIGYSNKINPMAYTGSKYCPNCGRKMNQEEKIENIKRYYILPEEIEKNF